MIREKNHQYLVLFHIYYNDLMVLGYLYFSYLFAIYQIYYLIHICMQIRLTKYYHLQSYI